MLSFPGGEFEYYLTRELNDEEKFVLNYFWCSILMLANLYDIRNCFNILHAGENNFNYKIKIIHFEISLKHFGREAFIGNYSMRTERHF